MTRKLTSEEMEKWDGFDARPLRSDTGIRMPDFVRKLLAERRKKDRADQLRVDTHEDAI